MHAFERPHYTYVFVQQSGEYVHDERAFAAVYLRSGPVFARLFAIGDFIPGTGRYRQRIGQNPQGNDFPGQRVDRPVQGDGGYDI